MVVLVVLGAIFLRMLCAGNIMCEHEVNSTMKYTLVCTYHLVYTSMWGNFILPFIKKNVEMGDINFEGIDKFTMIRMSFALFTVWC